MQSSAELAILSLLKNEALGQGLFTRYVMPALLSLLGVSQLAAAAYPTYTLAECNAVILHVSSVQSLAETEEFLPSSLRSQLLFDDSLQEDIQAAKGNSLDDDAQQVDGTERIHGGLDDMKIFTSSELDTSDENSGDDIDFALVKSLSSIEDYIAAKSRYNFHQNHSVLRTLVHLVTSPQPLCEVVVTDLLLRYLYLIYAPVVYSLTTI